MKMKSNLENVSLCTDSSNGTGCHHDCKLNISFPPHTTTKAIKGSSLPRGGRGGRFGHLKVHIQAPSHLPLKPASLLWKPSPIIVAREV